ncbi:MAG: septal ring lytic transglycosylase RlpA family protein [Solirubrobacteraceae bacterium]
MLALPATALASSASRRPSSGGSGLTPSGAPAAQSPVAVPVAGDGNLTVSAQGNGIAFATRASTMLRRRLSFAGTAPPGLVGDEIEIERSGHETHWRWTATVSATIAADGSFSATWHTNHIGRFAIRAVISSAADGPIASPAASGNDNPALTPGATASPPLTVIVYRRSRATEFGPGFWGQRTACGQRLRRWMIGVANRTLPCGTKVAIYYRGRTLVVPVIDRGPYANGADWDLTMATGRALGIDGTVELGAVSLPRR